MKTKKRFSRAGMALAVIMLLVSLFLCSCESTPAVDTSAESTTEAVPETTEAQPDYIELISSGKANVRVIRPDEADTGDSSVKAAMNIRKVLQKYSEEVEITTDWTKDGTHKNDIPEIIVGKTNYQETADVAADLGYGDYTVRFVGNKIVVFAFSESGITKAASGIIDAIIAGAEKQEDGTYTVRLNPETLKVGGTAEKSISAIPKMDGGNMNAYYDSGDGCEEIIIDSATPESYKAYLKKLEEAGYKCHTTNEITGNLFATYYNDSYTLNVGYYEYENTVRLILEPYSAETLIPTDSGQYEIVTTSQITMLGLAYYDADGSAKNNGLSIVIRLTDGRFVIVDGGFNLANHETQMVNLLKEQSKDYSTKTGGIKVAAWIITHAHGDHNGLFASKYATLKSNGVQIERFIVNNVSDSELERAYGSTYAGNLSETRSELKTSHNVEKAALTFGATVLPTHVGHVFHYANLTIETLYTIESYAPKVLNALNTTSLIMKMTFTDEKTGKQTTYMSTGDATGPAFLICTKMYGSYLKCDICQVAHHGATTWGTENGTIAAYKLIAPSTLLWPAGFGAYDKYKTENRNSVLLNLNTNPNYKEVYVAGWEGSVITLPMPYTVGSAYVKAANDPK